MDKINKAEQAYIEIRKLIVSRQMESGERLVERKMAERLDVNRADIRQACSRLEGEGLLVSGAKGGFFVISLNSQQSNDLFRARDAIEIGAAILAVKSATPKDIERLEEIVELMHTLAKNSMIEGFYEADLLFHEILVSSTHSKKLMDIYKSANFMLTNSISRTPDPKTLQIDAKKHKKILQALKKHNLRELLKQLSLDANFTLPDCNSTL
jgi:DNA-binding GntR family transcriptional regulator